MIMRVSWGRIKPGRWADFERLWNDGAAKLKGTEGLLAHWLLKESERADAGYSMSLWASPEAMNAASEMRKVTPEMEACFTGEYTRTDCEVRGSELAGLLAR